LDITVAQVDNTQVITLRGRLDSSTSAEFESQALGSLTADQPRLVISFSELNYISSAGLRVILILAKKIRQTHGRLALCEMSPAIREVFDISGFLSILTVRNTQAEALAEINL
jgi:anti-anti-sigma factor